MYLLLEDAEPRALEPCKGLYTKETASHYNLYLILSSESAALLYLGFLRHAISLNDQ